jgi:hypothetical protein
VITISHIYIYATAIFILSFITAQTYIWPQLRARCAGEEAVPSACVGDARPCAGREATRARSAAPQRPRQIRANQVRPCTCGRWDATAPTPEARRRCKDRLRATAARRRVGEAGYGPHDHMHRLEVMHPGHGRPGTPSRQSGVCRSRCNAGVRICPSRLPTDQNWADIFTKPLAADKFYKFWKQMCGYEP